MTGIHDLARRTGPASGKRGWRFPAGCPTAGRAAPAEPPGRNQAGTGTGPGGDAGPAASSAEPFEQTDRLAEIGCIQRVALDPLDPAARAAPARRISGNARMHSIREEIAAAPRRAKPASARLGTAAPAREDHPGRRQRPQWRYVRAANIGRLFRPAGSRPAVPAAGGDTGSADPTHRPSPPERTGSA